MLGLIAGESQRFVNIISTAFTGVVIPLAIQKFKSDPGAGFSDHCYCSDRCVGVSGLFRPCFRNARLVDLALAFFSCLGLVLPASGSLDERRLVFSLSGIRIQ